MKSDKFDLNPRRKVHGHSDVPLKGRSYRKFRRWLDRRLERLVTRWAHAAAPDALRQTRMRKPKPK